jgi:cyclohexanone monooxygenase
MRRSRLASIEVRRSAQERFNHWLQRPIDDTSWSAGCQNYYHAPSGKLVTNWPHSSVLYWALTRTFAAPARLLYRRQRTSGSSRG